MGLIVCRRVTVFFCLTNYRASHVEVKLYLTKREQNTYIVKPCERRNIAIFIVSQNLKQIFSAFILYIRIHGILCQIQVDTKHKKMTKLTKKHLFFQSKTGFFDSFVSQGIGGIRYIPYSIQKYCVKFELLFLQKFCIALNSDSKSWL